MAVFESSVAMCESSAVPVCESSVAAVMCESSDVAAFETSIQKPSSQIKSIFIVVLNIADETKKIW